MPVRITTALGESDPRAISADQLATGIEDFNKHYCQASLPTPMVLPAPGHVLAGQTNKVSWDAFFAAVEDYKDEFGISEDDIALRFVHCFDDMSSSLYHRVQILEMGEPHLNEEGKWERQLIDTNSKWYKIKGQELTPTDEHTLTDQLYVNSVMYKPAIAAAAMELIEQYPLKFVHNLTFPWLSEIYTMYEENQSPDGADLNFAVYTHPMHIPEESDCEFPHGMVIYLSVGTHNYIDNEHYVSVFHNRGADDATMCPPMCGKYILPAF